jgi:hypothetical protein
MEAKKKSAGVLRFALTYRFERINGYRRHAIAQPFRPDQSQRCILSTDALKHDRLLVISSPQQVGFSF